MNKTQLKILLSRLEPVADKHPSLEQYQTPSDIAAELLTQADLAGDIDGKTVIDLGTGNGILALGAAVLGAEQVYAYDVDENSLDTAKQNKRVLEEELGREFSVEFIEKDVQDVEEGADTVVMNPPFGLQRGNRQANKVFLKEAFERAPTIYTLLHQADEKRDETRDHLAQLAEQHGFDATILSWFWFPIPREYAFHAKEQERVKVDLYKFFHATSE